MALLFFDGFDHYSDAATMQLKWPTYANGSQTFAAGRFGGQCVAVDSYRQFRKALGVNTTTTIVGFAFNFYQGTPNGTVFGLQFYDVTAGAAQLGLACSSAGLISVYRLNANGTPGTKIGDTSLTVQWNQWYYVEMKVVWATGATGSVAVNAGNVQVANFTNVQTAATANAYCNAINLVTDPNGSGGIWTYVDDVYVCDGTGTQNNDFLGERKVSQVFPAGAGRVTQWGTQVGGTAGQPWTAVNDASPNGDTSYIADATAGDVEAFTLGAFAAIQQVSGVQVNVVMRKDDTASHAIGVGVGNGATENFDAGTSCLSSYSMVTRTLDANPLSGQPWVAGDLAGLQAAVKVVS